MTLNTLCEMTNQSDLLIPPLLKALEDADDSGRYYIIHYFGEVGPAAKAAVPKLVLLSTDPNTNVCRIATNALDKIKPGWRSSK
jgi:HEAT repeat protein